LGAIARADLPILIDLAIGDEEVLLLWGLALFGVDVLSSFRFCFWCFFVFLFLGLDGPGVFAARPIQGFCYRLISAGMHHRFLLVV
jgi:hypothetical protein